MKNALMGLMAFGLLIAGTAARASETVNITDLKLVSEEVSSQDSLAANGGNHHHGHSHGHHGHHHHGHHGHHHHGHHGHHFSSDLNVNSASMPSPEVSLN